MPNWCYNYLSIEGDSDALKKFDEQFKSEHSVLGGGAITCLNENFKPEEYKKYIAYKKMPYNNYIIHDEDSINKCTINYIESESTEEGYSFNNFVERTKEAFLSGWYEWCNSNWGTKWDLTDMSENISEIDGEILSPEASTHYSFTTAWCAPMPVIIEMSRQYPDLEFELSAEEEGCQYAGVYKLIGGCITEEEEAGNDDMDYKHFMMKHFDREYCKCKDCGGLYEEYDIDENDGKCPNCDSDNVLGLNGEKFVL